MKKAGIKTLVMMTYYMYFNGKYQYVGYKRRKRYKH